MDRHGATHSVAILAQAFCLRYCGVETYEFGNGICRATSSQSSRVCVETQTTRHVERSGVATCCRACLLQLESGWTTTELLALLFGGSFVTRSSTQRSCCNGGIEQSSQIDAHEEAIIELERAQALLECRSESMEGWVTQLWNLGQGLPGPFLTNSVQDLWKTSHPVPNVLCLSLMRVWLCLVVLWLTNPQCLIFLGLSFLFLMMILSHLPLHVTNQHQ